MHKIIGAHKYKKFSIDIQDAGWETAFSIYPDASSNHPLTAAKDYLENTDKNISELARLVSYEKSSVF